MQISALMVVRLECLVPTITTVQHWQQAQLADPLVSASSTFTHGGRHMHHLCVGPILQVPGWDHAKI